MPDDHQDESSNERELEAEPAGNGWCDQPGRGKQDRRQHADDADRDARERDVDPDQVEDRRDRSDGLAEAERDEKDAEKSDGSPRPEGSRAVELHPSSLGGARGDSSCVKWGP